MIIKADKDAQKMLAELADLVLKAVGLQGYNKVGQLLGSIQVIPEEPVTEEVKE